MTQRGFHVGWVYSLPNERAAMVSNGLKDLLSHLKAREEIAGFKTPMDRMRANLHELTDEDIVALVGASVVAAESVSGPGPHDYAMSLMTVGLELGRELERRI